MVSPGDKNQGNFSSPYSSETPDEEPEFSFYDPRGLANRRRGSSASPTSTQKKDALPSIPGQQQQFQQNVRKTSTSRISSTELAELVAPSQTLVRNMSNRVRLALEESSSPQHQESLSSSSSADNTDNNTDNNNNAFPIPISDSSTSTFRSTRPVIRPINTVLPPPLPTSTSTTTTNQYNQNRRAVSTPPLTPQQQLLQQQQQQQFLSPATDESTDSYNSANLARSPAVEFLSSFVDRATIANPDDEGSLVDGYRIGRTLGEGGFSVVKEARNVDTHECVAVKIIKRPQSMLPTNTSGTGTAGIATTSSAVDSITRRASTSVAEPEETSLARITSYLEREIYICSLLEPHPHIVPILKLHSTPFATFIFMPLCTRGNLLQFINNAFNPFKGSLRRVGEQSGGNNVLFSSPSPTLLNNQGSNSSTNIGGGGGGGTGLDFATIKSSIHQVASGLHYLHTRAFVTHNDLKLENVLLGDDGLFRIADFGLASLNNPSISAKKRVPSHVSKHLPGEPDRQPPSLSTPPPHHHHHNPIEQLQQEERDGSSSLNKDQLQQQQEPYAAQIQEENAFSAPDGRNPGSGFGAKDYCSIPFVGSNLAAGSIQYCPPEQVQAIVQSVEPSVDIWALGCIIYALFSGRLPFDDDYEPRLRVKISKGDWEIPWALTSEASQYARDPHEYERERLGALELLKGCLEKRVKRRWKIGRVLKCDWLCELTYQRQSLNYGDNYDTTSDVNEDDDCCDSVSAISGDNNTHPNNSNIGSNSRGLGSGFGLDVGAGTGGASASTGLGERERERERENNNDNNDFGFGFTSEYDADDNNEYYGENMLNSDFEERIGRRKSVKHVNNSMKIQLRQRSRSRQRQAQAQAQQQQQQQQHNHHHHPHHHHHHHQHHHHHHQHQHSTSSSSSSANNNSNSRSLSRGRSAARLDHHHHSMSSAANVGQEYHRSPSPGLYRARGRSRRPNRSTSTNATTATSSSTTANTNITSPPQSFEDYHHHQHHQHHQPSRRSRSRDSKPKERRRRSSSSRSSSTRKHSLERNNSAPPTAIMTPVTPSFPSVQKESTLQE